MTHTGGAGPATPSERRLFALCRETFLSMWSFSNPFRDQFNSGGGDGKEICDVLVVFGDTILLFSDKECAIGSKMVGRAALDRWRRRAIDASVKQLLGASRWIRSYPGRLFRDRKCTTPLPFPLPSPERLKIVRIGVASVVRDSGVASSERYGQWVYQGTSGQKVSEDAAFDELASVRALASTQAGDGFVHCFDVDTLGIILRDTGTITDFISYLDARVEVLESAVRVGLLSDLAMIASWCGSESTKSAATREYGNFVVSSATAIRMIEATTVRPASLRPTATREAFWEYLIENHTRYCVMGELANGSVKTIAENEEILRILARESRHSRQELSSLLFDFLYGASAIRDVNVVGSRTVPRAESGVLYIFQRCDRLSNESEADFVVRRNAHMMARAVKNACDRDWVGSTVVISARGRSPRGDGVAMMAISLSAIDDQLRELAAKIGMADKENGD